VFEWLVDAWVQRGSTIYGDNDIAQLGMHRSVSLNGSGDILAVGHKYFDSNDVDTNVGQVKVYSWNNTNGDWIQLGSTLTPYSFWDFISGVDPKNAYFGAQISISADGSILAVREAGNDGIVRVYEFVNGDWYQFGQDLTGFGYGSGFSSAISLSADGETLIIGSTFPDFSAEKKGQVEVYKFDGSRWYLFHHKFGSSVNDHLGGNVVVSSNGTYLAVAAYGNAMDADFQPYTSFSKVDNNLTDEDNDGLPTHLEILAGTDDNSFDSDGDLFGDYVEYYTAGFNPAVNVYFSLTSNVPEGLDPSYYIVSQPTPSMLSTNEAYSMLDSAYADDIVMSVSNDVAEIVMTIEQSTNLSVGSWTTNKFVTNSIPVDSDASFFRFRLVE
jgi:hypothetical protein